MATGIYCALSPRYAGFEPNERAGEGITGRMKIICQQLMVEQREYVDKTWVVLAVMEVILLYAYSQ
jgi:hypothetical protein